MCRTFYCPIESYRELSLVLKIKRFDSCSWASRILRFITGVNVNIAPKPIPYNLHLWQMCSSKVLQTQDGERCRLFYVDELTMDIQLWRQWNHCVGDKNCRPDKNGRYMFWFDAPKALILKNKSQIFKTTHTNHSRLLPQKTFLPIPDDDQNVQIL